MGTALRITYQNGRAFTNDEAGSVLWLSYGYTYLLTHFNVWLSMNVYLALTKFLATVSQGNPWVMVAPSLLSGAATIPLTAAVGVRVTSARAAVVAAWLVAGNPFLIFYSVQLRSYMPLTACCLTSLVFFLDWRRSERWADGIACAIAMLLAVLMHANGVYFAGFLLVLFAHWLWAGVRRWRLAVTLVLAGIAAALVACIVYAPIHRPMRELGKDWTDVSPTSVSYIPYVAGEYFGRGFRILPSLAFLSWGAWTASQRNHSLAMLTFGAIVPVAMASLAGLSHYPWAYARFLIFALPLLLLILAEGVTNGPWAGHALLCVALTSFVLSSWTSDLRRQFEEKSNRPWGEIAGFLRSRIEPGDVLVASDYDDAFPALNLRVHLGKRRNSYNFPPVSSFLEPSKAAEPGRIFFIEPHEPIVTTAPQAQFGTVQVVVYSAPTRRAEAEALLADLEQSLHGQVSDTRTGDYRLVLDLLAALGHPDVGYSNLRLYYRCLMRTPRQRWAPRQKLGIPPDRN
jgi:hypothetical protein